MLCGLPGPAVGSHAAPHTRTGTPPLLSEDWRTAARFAGCPVDSVVSALGLRLSDLFPPRSSDHPPERRPWPAEDVLRAVAHEALITAIAMENVARGGALSTADRDRLARGRATPGCGGLRDHIMTGLVEKAEVEMRHAERGAEFLDQFRRQRQARSHTEGREEAPAAAPAQLSENWPEPLAEAAYHGLAGRVVRAIAPHTEADPAAILIQYLVAFGSVVGRGPYYAVEGDRHGPNLYAVIVGATAKGRKGTSWGRVREIFQRVDDPWASKRVLSGLSSGEGLIWAVRDPSDDDDPGVADKRLLVIEAEYASVLRVLDREGNRLSPVIRDAWDTGDLRTLTKTSPASATGAHISIIGQSPPTNCGAISIEPRPATATRIVTCTCARAERNACPTADASPLRL
jgi:hypothetical protein